MTTGRKKWKQCQILFSWTPKSLDGDCNHEIKRPLLLGRKAMTHQDRVLKSRAITLLTKVHIVKVVFISVVIYGCESWIIKKLITKELMLLNCGAWMLQVNCESLGQQGDPS